MRDHLKAFLEHLRLNENASPHTVRAYDSDLTQYLAFLAADAGGPRSSRRARVARRSQQARQLQVVRGAEAVGDPRVRALPAP
jgi:site-specific recombinase XerD